jgi:hypothetical protein
MATLLTFLANLLTDIRVLTGSMARRKRRPFANPMPGFQLGLPNLAASQPDPGGSRLDARCRSLSRVDPYI